MNFDWSQCLRELAVLFVLAGMAILLFGCSKTERTEGKRILERVETPTADGGKVTRETERTETGSESVTKADLQVALQAAVAGLRGDIPGAVAALIPKPPGISDFVGALPPPKEDKILGLTTTEMLTLAGVVWGGERGVSAWHKRRRLQTETAPKRR
jgi:hypothetical protein